MLDGFEKFKLGEESHELNKMVADANNNASTAL
jgi:hypothetical protein